MFLHVVVMLIDWLVVRMIEASQITAPEHNPV